MRQITDMELWNILEALNNANAEISAAEEDGWVVTTDVYDGIAASKRTIGAILTGPKTEVK